MKITDRIKQIIGVTDAVWDSNQKRLIVYYFDTVPLDTMKIRVAGAIGDAALQDWVSDITLISHGV